MIYSSDVSIGVDKHEFFQRIQRRIKKNRVIVMLCFAVPVLLLFYSVVHIGYQLEVEVESDVEQDSELVGSNLSHIMRIKGGWSYRLEVEEIVAKNDVLGETFGVANLQGVKITASNSERGQNIVLYSPKAIWEQEKLLFHMFGGCQVRQGKDLDLTTEAILVDMDKKLIRIEDKLRARYSDGWIFEASGVTWDMEEDNLTFDGDIIFGKRDGEL